MTICTSEGVTVTSGVSESLDKARHTAISVKMQFMREDQTGAVS
jgi:hypothetical protein